MTQLPVEIDDEMQLAGAVYVLDPLAPRLYEQLVHPSGKFQPLETGVYRLTFTGGVCEAHIVSYSDFVSDVSSAPVALAGDTEDDFRAQERAIASIPQFRKGSMLKWQKCVPWYRDAWVGQAMTWVDFLAALDHKPIVLTPWCGEKDAEEDVMNKSAADVCIPLDQGLPRRLPLLPDGTPCFVTGKPAKSWALWSRSIPRKSDH